MYNQEIVHLSWTTQIFPFVYTHPNNKAKCPSFISFVSYEKLLETKQDEIWFMENEYRKLI